MTSTTFLTTLLNETPEQKLIKFVFHNTEFLQKAIAEGSRTICSIPDIKYNTFRAYVVRCFYGSFCFYGKTRTLNLPNECFEALLNLLRSYNEFRPYIDYYRSSTKIVQTFERLFRYLLTKTVNKSALREAINFSGIGSNSMRRYAYKELSNDLIQHLTPHQITSLLSDSTSPLLCTSL